MDTRRPTWTVKDKSVEMEMDRMWVDATGYCSVEPWLRVRNRGIQRWRLRGCRDILLEARRFVVMQKWHVRPIRKKKSRGVVSRSPLGLRYGEGRERSHQDLPSQ